MSRRFSSAQTHRQKIKLESAKCLLEQRHQSPGSRNERGINLPSSSRSKAARRRKGQGGNRSNEGRTQSNRGEVMTLRQTLLALLVGESHTFETVDKAKSAAAAAQKIYGRAYMRSLNKIVRLE